jgi:hypothetical protein
MSKIFRNKQILEKLIKSQTRIKDYYIVNNIPPTLNEDTQSILNLEKHLQLRHVPFKSFENIINESREIQTKPEKSLFGILLYSMYSGCLLITIAHAIVN